MSDDAEVARSEARRFCSHPATRSWAEDAAQEALVALWLHPDVQQRHTVARRAIIDAWRAYAERVGRARRRWAEPVDPSTLPDVEDHHSGPVELYRPVLTDRQRQVVALLAEEWTQAEIAAELGCHYSNVSLIVKGIRQEWSRMNLSRA